MSEAMSPGAMSGVHEKTLKTSPSNSLLVSEQAPNTKAENTNKVTNAFFI
ncbi:hypothetical protein GCM10007176_20460 [Salinicoccus roseus]|nr:hypothetical protein GCM10007176_20460 [Salinicoccus roseus]